MRNNQCFKNGVIWGGLFLLIMLLSLCGCSPSAKSEREIIADLQQNPAFISETIKIDDCEIIKRQTDKDSKSDIVYITVYVNEEDLTCELSYVMEYVLYNEGWILENVSRYDDGPWSIEGLPIERISADVTDYDFYFNDYILEVTDCEILNEGYNYDGEEYEKWFVVAITASNPIFNYRATYEAMYKIAGDGWSYQYAIPNFSGYSPAYSPDISATDDIMESLELGSGASATCYDSYEYLETETDWENCAETRYYTAKKDWWFGTETYLVSIPLKFSLENGNDSSRWTYSSNDIESSLQSVDWNIEGTWEASGYGEQVILWTQDSWDVELNIVYIIPTNKPNEFYAYVNSNSVFNGIFTDYSCVSDGFTSATIRQNEPGQYQLDLDGFKNGTFWIQQKSFGISWENIILEMTYSRRDEVEEAVENIISAAKSLELEIVSYDPENPIYGLWKEYSSGGLIEITYFSPDGTVIYAPTFATPVYFTSTYTYDGTYLILGDSKQFINWENDDLFSVPDSAWIRSTRIMI